MPDPTRPAENPAALVAELWGEAEDREVRGLPYDARLLRRAAQAIEALAAPGAPLPSCSICEGHHAPGDGLTCAMLANREGK